MCRERRFCGTAREDENPEKGTRSATTSRISPIFKFLYFFLLFLSLSLFLSSSSTRSISRATRTFVFALEDVWTAAWRKILGRIFRYYLFHYPPSLSFSTRIFLLPSPLSFFSESTNRRSRRKMKITFNANSRNDNEISRISVTYRGERAIKKPLEILAPSVSLENYFSNRR